MFTSTFDPFSISASIQIKHYIKYIIIHYATIFFTFFSVNVMNYIVQPVPSKRPCHDTFLLLVPSA